MPARPQAVPEGSVNFAFIGRFAEQPEGAVVTMDYSVRSARRAIAKLRNPADGPPRVRQGHQDPKALAEALKVLT